MKIKRIAQIAVSILGLICVRAFQESLFYDPFINYFKSDFQSTELPSFEIIPYLLSTLFRYVLNLLFSLLIIWAIFKNRNFLKAALWVELFAFLILFGCLLGFMALDFEWIKMTIFYIRRFLIHPILLFILVPGFYFLNKKDDLR